MTTKKKEPMPFGKLMMLFGGGFVGLMVLTALIIMMMGKKPAPKQMPAQQPQAPITFNEPQSQVGSGELNEYKRQTNESLINIDSAIQQLQAQQQQLAEQQKAIVEAIKTAQTQTQAQPQKVEIIKQNDPARVSVSRPKLAQPAAKYQGYEVVSTVGDIVWVNVGDNTVPVKIGEPVPGAK